MTETRHEWINDGLMGHFLLCGGLEIKPEVLIGEMSSLRQAVFPLIAAVGGVIIPALLYLAAAHSGDTPKGWAIPKATDIAFVLGVFAMLGSRVPAIAVYPAELVCGSLQSYDDAQRGSTIPAVPQRVVLEPAARAFI